uniref:NADH-ubiquinone oxidoreductase chain 6 n=1 Tax=Nannochorista philpotti TaxID=1260225 RepID=E9NQ82_9NEOP|nr:NADH dehydrogenase subunit 6 [Nannochorista philpotti]
MFQFMFSFISIMVSLLFIQMKHPMSMGLILLIQTILTCLILGLMNQTFWFSYILFLVFLGGMLILFIYMTSLASNEMFSFSFKSLLMMCSMLLIMLMVFLIIDPYYLNPLMSNQDMALMQTSSTLMMNPPQNLKMYNSPSSLITLLLINYLFLTLIAIVKITYIFSGPLRQHS